TFISCLSFPVDLFVWPFQAFFFQRIPQEIIENSQGMESAVSVSKGCFVYKNGSMGPKGNKRKKKGRSSENQGSILPQSILNSGWFTSYRKFWEKINSRIEEILEQNYSNAMENVLGCIEKSKSSIYSTLFPVIVLQTGINQPDHLSMFEHLAEKISQQEHLYSVVLTSTEATNVKGAIETLAGGFIRQLRDEDVEIRKQNCTMRSLCGAFAGHSNTSTVLAVVIPDFEVFCKETLRELVTILASYRPRLPLVIVFGVATSISALEQLLPLKFTTRAKFHVFQTQSSVSVLNEIIEQVILEEKIHLSGRVMQFLVEKFLFYDFSVSGFIQGLKFCLLEHFSHHEELSMLALGASPATSPQNHEDCENVRRLMSVRRYIEDLADSQEVISLLTNDNHLKTKIANFWIPEIEDFFLFFHAALRFLHELVRDLPKAPLGKQLREVYCFCSANSIVASEEFAECKQILGLMAREAFTEKIDAAASKVVAFLEKKQKNHSNRESLQKIQMAMKSLQEGARKTSGKPVEEHPAIDRVANRFELKKMLLEKAKQQNRASGQAEGIAECLKELEEEVLAQWLVPFARGPPLIELFVHMDASSTRRHLMGSPRGALHQALTNPHHYLQG
uniref:Origin recognition complex subunit 3 n=2 Tax=Lutzomyia longipalpis TaxID=7200 RepID=A0A1B0CKM1_LUTLO